MHTTSLLSLTLILPLALSVAACAGRPAPAAAPVTPSDAESVQPPPEGWQTDAEGRQYYVDKVARTDAVRIDATQVRLRWGVTVTVVAEDEQSFHYRVYKPVAEPVLSPTVRPAVDVEKLYRVDVKTTRDFRFEPFDTGLPRSGQWRDGFALADMNGDGHRDVVHGPARKTLRTPSIFLGDGAGTWRRWAEATWPPLPYDYGDAAVADFDGDGHADLVLGLHLKGVLAVLGDGRGAFRPAMDGLEVVAPGKPLPFSSHALAVADWNADGRPDVLALGEGPRPALGGNAPPAANGVRLYVSEGSGRWTRRGDANSRVFGDGIAVGDVDGDGRLDFVTGTSVMGLRTLLHLGQPDGSWEAVELEPIRPLSFVRSVGLADLDGDSRLDIVVGYLGFEGDEWRSGIDVLRRDGTAWTRTALHHAAGKGTAPSLAVGDLDGDGRKDVVAATGDGEVLVFRGRGDGTFTRESAPAPHLGRCRGVHVELGDLDGRAGDEIVVAFAEESSDEDPGRCPDEGGISAWRLTAGQRR